MFDFKIDILIKEYLDNTKTEGYTRIFPKGKKITAFKKWVLTHNIKKDDIIEKEKKYFKFCTHCDEVILFKCLDGVYWSFEKECQCDKIRIKLNKEMKDRINKHKQEIKKRELEYEMQRLF